MNTRLKNEMVSWHRTVLRISILVSFFGLLAPSIVQAAEPYIKVFGGDIHAGYGGTVGEDGSCVVGSPGSGAINTNAASTNKGSSVQYGAFAAGRVDNFFSAGLRSSPSLTIPPKDLTFANTLGTTAVSTATWGGGFGTAPCMENYWQTLRGPSVVNRNSYAIDLATGSDQEEYSWESGDPAWCTSSIYNASNVDTFSGNTAIGSDDACFSLCEGCTGLGDDRNRDASGTDIGSKSLDVPYTFITTDASKNDMTEIVNLRSRKTIFVDDDLKIWDDILYISTSGGRTQAIASAADLPYLTVVVCGNIYIDHAVNVLSGLFIAVPRTSCDSTANSALGGTIYTCMYAARIVDGTFPGVYFPISAKDNILNHQGGCDNPLTVYGGLIARNIKFQRTHGHTGDAQISEGIGSDATPSDWQPAGPGYLLNKVAEKFIHGPEMWMTGPVQGSPGSATPGPNKFDSVTGLPPVL